MADNRWNAIIRKQYKIAIGEEHCYLKFYMNESKLSEWFVLASGFGGDHGEYVGGEYLIRMEVPKTYPADPPHFYFMTPQGLYGVEKKVCISIGEYHKSNYRAVLGIIGFCNNLVSGLIGWETLGRGIEILHTTKEEKMKLASASVAYNARNNAQIIEKIKNAYAEYSLAWQKKDEPTLRPNAT
jgi:ubiquitin-conjugating enzyme E2 J2